MESKPSGSTLRDLIASGSRRIRIVLILGAIAVVGLFSLIGAGVARQGQLSQTIRESAETGRIVVQLQRETLRLMALVNADQATVEGDDAQLQRDLLASRFNVVSQNVTRSFLPPDTLTRVEGIEEQWADLQPYLDEWLANPQNEDNRAELAERLAAMERVTNETEINFHRQRIDQISSIAADSQQWLIALGGTALMIIILIGFLTNDLIQVTRQQQDTLAAEAAARESNRLKSEFLATMSHELRTPLNGVIGYADFLLTAMGGNFNEKQADYLKRILSNGERLLRLVDDILDVSRIESGRLELLQTPYSPFDVMDNLKPDLQTMAANKGLTITTRVDPTLPTQMIGDRQRLAQIVINLTWNAVKFTEKGSVDVHFKHKDDHHWAIIVTDTGVGIPLHMQDVIFEKFRQVDGSNERKQGGAGLGLHIVRNLAVLMGGSINVQSEVDKGSTFTVDLPIMVPQLVKV